MEEQIDGGEQLGKLTLKYLGKYHWKLNKSLVLKLGIIPALWLTHLIEKQDYFEKKGVLDKEGFFYNVQSYIEKETTISQDKQTSIIKLLKELKILEVVKKGLPARNYYRIKMENLISFIVDESENSGTSSGKIRELVPGKFRNIINTYKKRKKIKINPLETKVSKGALTSSGTPPPSGRKPLIRKTPAPKENNSVKPSGPILRIIESWNNYGLHRNKNPSTKIYKRTVELLKKIRRGSFDREGFKDRKFADEEILRSIKNFSLAANDPLYDPAEGEYKDYLKKLCLHDFIYNEWSSKSLLLYYLDNEPKEVEPNTPDYYPPVTREFEDLYVKEVLGNVRNGPFSSHEKRCFRKGGKMLVDFFNDIGDKCWLSSEQRKYPELLVPYVFHALKKEHNDNLSKVTPGWFSQPSLYSRTLLAYLHQQALITGED